MTPLLLTFMLAGYWHGRDLAPKAICLAMMIVVAAAYAYVSLPIATAGFVAGSIILSTLAFYVPSHGIFFSAFTWQWVGKPALFGVSTLLEKLIPIQTANVHWTNGHRGAVGFTIKGAFWALPLIACALYLGVEWWHPLWALLAGPIYALNRYGGSHTIMPEIVMAAIFAAAIHASFYV